MARLIRCDRCNEEIEVGRERTAQVEFPILNTDEVTGDHKAYDLCFHCLQGMWTWFRGLVKARR